MMSMSARIRRWLVFGVLLGLSLVAPLAKAAETVTYYYTNQQGTPLATADASGNILTTSDYRPYGSQVLGSPAGGPGYTGHVNDPDSGLVYMQARYYDPVVGRFLAEDPASATLGDVFTFDRYEYADSDPANEIDPSGLCATDAQQGDCLSSDNPQTQSPNPPPPPKSNPQTPPSPKDAIPLPGPTVRPPRSTSWIPPIFKLPSERPIFRRTLTRFVVKKADDMASQAVIKRLSFKMLKIGSRGLEASPWGVIFYSVTDIPDAGSCDDNGVCRDEAPQQPQSKKAPSEP